MADFATLVLGAETAGLKKAEPALDAVIAKAGRADAAVKKMGAATRQMGSDAQAGATRAKAALDGIEVEAKAAEASLRQAATGLDAMARSAAGAGGAAQASAGQVGNLTAQVFDIGMMMQAGQNPFQLMIQQGSQVAQVLGPMGASGALQAFKGVFASLLSPVNLLTFGVIGLTAALVPMVTQFFSGAEAADAQKAAMERQKEILTALADETMRLRLERQMMDSGAESTEEQEALNELTRLTKERADAQERLNSLNEIGSRAAGFAEQAAAQREVLQAQIATYDEAIKTLEAERSTTAAAEEHARAVASAYEVYARTRQEADELADEAVRAGLAASDLSLVDFGNIDAGAAAALRMAGNLGIAYGKAVALAGALSRLTTGDDERGSQRSTVAGANTRKPDQPWLDTYDRGGWIDLPDAGGRGGGGGGGGGRDASAAAAEREAEAIQKVVDKLKSEIEQVGMNDEARRLHQELQRAGVSIYSEEGQAIAALVEELTELEAKQKLAAETMRGIESAAQGFFVGVLSGAKDLSSAIGDLLRQLGNLLLNQAFKMLWEGKPGGGGGLAGFVAGLVGAYDSGGHIRAGEVGLVGEKRPEIVDGRLVTRPTLVAGPADVTGGAATARMMGVPAPQIADRPRSATMAAPAPRVTVTPPPVVVLDDPRKIDVWQRSPEGERTAAWQRKRMGRNG